MKKSYDVVVIGGGIIGSAIAYYVAKEKVDVAVLEAGQIGGEATSAAAGMLGAHSEYEEEVKTFFPFARHSQSLYATLKDELYALSGVDIGVREGGILKLAFSAQDTEELAAVLTQPTVTWLEAAEVKTRVRGIAEHVVGAAYIEEDVNVLPARVCEAFAKSAKACGASIIEQTKVLHIQKQQDRFQLETTNGLVEAKRIVVASGVWSTPFFHQLGLTHTMTPVKGECIAVKGDAVLKHTIFHDKYYIVPRNNGELVIGATMRENDWSEQVSVNGMAALIQKAKELLPAVGNMNIVASWSGLRPQTFDEKPLIGHHPADDAILFATGHYRNGVLLAPATGEMIANLLLNRPVNEAWVEAFRVDRR